MLDHGDPAQYLITQRYIESLKEMSKGNNSKVVFMPVETSTMLSSSPARRAGQKPQPLLRPARPVYHGFTEP